jgi:hypothetical protein
MLLNLLPALCVYSFVCGLCWEMYRVQLQQYFTELIQASRPAGTAIYFGVLAGRLFEDHAVRMLAAGGKFKSKLERRSKKIRIPESTLDLIVDESTDIAALIAAAPTRAGPSMGYPVDPSFPAIDAIQIHGAEVRFFQMKNVQDGSRNEIRADLLTQLQAYWPGTIIELYQVVPDFRYEKLAGFKYTYANRRAAPRPPNIQEGKLCIDMPSFLAT